MLLSLILRKEKKNPKKSTISCQTLEIKYVRMWLQRIRLETTMKCRGPGPKGLPDQAENLVSLIRLMPAARCVCECVYVCVIHKSWRSDLSSNLAAHPSRLLIGSSRPAQVPTICRSRSSPNPTTVPTMRQRAAEEQWRPCPEGTLWCRYANLSATAIKISLTSNSPYLTC